ncbi:MAG: 50S ribosomal protein L6 [Candidatus Peregrinibacteria bacterium]
MSRIGRKPVAILSGVTVNVAGNVVSVKGSKGTLTFGILPEVAVKVEGQEVIVTRLNDGDDGRARQGLTRQIVANMIIGVATGYQKSLEIIGVGFKVQIQPKKLALSLGFSHPVDFAIPEGISVTQDEKNKNLITISGIDKQLVGQTAANIRILRPPEPYKGKGIRYTTEFVRRKAGKAAVGKGASAA